MQENSLLTFIRKAAEVAPNVRQHLNDKARYMLYVPSAYKTQSYFLAQIEGLVTSLYNNMIGGEFVDVMANLISGQIYDAYHTAWIDSGGLGAMPAYLEMAYTNEVLKQYPFVDGYFRAIIDARLDGTPLAPLLARAELWANQYGTAYENATSLITLQGGGNEEWVLGATEEHCHECDALNGFVMRAEEWESLNLRPKNPPNKKLTCGGWRCDCERRPTDKRRSPNAYGRVEEILFMKQ